MCVIWRLNDDAVLLLPAHKAVLDPWILKNLIHVSTFARIELEHPSDDVTRLTWQQSEQAQGTFDGGLRIGLRSLPRHWLRLVSVFVLVMVVVFVVFRGGVASVISGRTRVSRCWL
jgi:hypothetical protein